MKQSEQPLSGLRFLIIEDERLQAMRLGEMLTEMGGTVSGTAYSYEEARKAIDNVDFDCALLDINLNGTLSFPIADVLTAQGLPFVFCTAYADATDVYPHAPDILRVDKPVEPTILREAVLSTVLAATP